MGNVVWPHRHQLDDFLLLRDPNASLNGLSSYREFIKLVIETGRKKTYYHAHEWCCGSGAIGFYLLSQKICHRLTLSDICKDDLVGCAYTAAANNIQEIVNIYQIQRITDIPKPAKWDLVVGNPPWRPAIPEVEWGGLTKDETRIMVDLDWTVHNAMWQDLPGYLSDDADIYFYEDSNFSSKYTWQQQIKQAGLQVYAVYENFGSFKSGYIMHLIKL